MRTVILAGLVLALGQAHPARAGQQPRDRTARRPAMTLTPQDYVEIQQLSARYAFLIDSCTNGGYDFADLFTEDGEFSVSEQWGVAGTIGRSKGRDALAAAGGGDGKGGCRDPKTLVGYGISHVIVNHVITPAPGGSTGKSYLLAIGVGGNPTTIERQGGYEDVYVKTPAGWRFKSRTHVFPNLRQSVQFGAGRGLRGRADGAAAPSSPR